VSLAVGLDHVVCLLNRSEGAGIVKVRLFLGKRSPECFVEVPARGARLVSLAAEFGVASGGESLPGYLRVSTKGDQVFGVQFLSRSGSRDDRSDADSYAVVS
jgi:hypothetical protein